jgi:predicted RNase H-like HicB family nuclease
MSSMTRILGIPNVGPAVVQQCPDTGLYVGHVPGIPGAHSQGATLNELSENLEQVTSMLKRILIIPDIHLRHHQAEQIIGEVKPTLTVFLGDYFDDFYDSPQANSATAHWLKNSLEKPDRIHLMGNHDAHYRWPHMACSGFSPPKCVAIRKVLGEEGFAKLKLWHYDQESNTLFTHAGLTQPLVERRGGWRKALEEADVTPKPNPRLACAAGERNWLYAPGMKRGGPSRFGGPLWCDLSEFVPIAGLNQVFGHTPAHEPVLIREGGQFNLCLDTHSNHYALIENGKLAVHPSLPPAT